MTKNKGGIFIMKTLGTVNLKTVILAGGSVKVDSSIGTVNLQNLANALQPYSCLIVTNSSRLGTMNITTIARAKRFETSRVIFE